MRMRAECVMEKQNGVQRKLEDEFEKLKRILGLDLDFGLVWIPSTNNCLSGEVKNGNIFIYELDECRAMKTLKHELIDYCVSLAIKPYKKITNMLIKKINRDAYEQKERVVEALTRFLIERVDD